MIPARFACLALACLLANAGLADEPEPARPDAPMPKGFPDPTSPGTIEVKRYPSYRSAWTSGDGLSQRSGDMMFFWLFRHISRRNVEMTAPVINTYVDPEVAVDPEARGELTMEFLYERPDQGEVGEGVGPVKVKDFPPMTVVALGLQGEMNPERMSEGVARLRSWIEEHKGDWAEAGPPRRLGYHGPMTPTDRRLWEVQIPINPAGDTTPQNPGGEQPEAIRPEGTPE